MGRAESRPIWQTIVLITVFTGVIVGLAYAFRKRPQIQIVIFALLGGGLSLTALREKTRRGKLSRLFMGLFIFSIFLSTVPQLDVALIPAVVFWILTVYYGFSDMVNEDPLGVHDDQTENQR